MPGTLADPVKLDFTQTITAVSWITDRDLYFIFHSTGSVENESIFLWIVGPGGVELTGPDPVILALPDGTFETVFELGELNDQFEPTEPDLEHIVINIEARIAQLDGPGATLQTLYKVTVLDEPTNIKFEVESSPRAVGPVREVVATMTLKRSNGEGVWS